MGYLKGDLHFLNYIKKCFKTEQKEFIAELARPLLKFFAWSLSDNNGDAVNRMTWEIKERGVDCLTEDFVNGYKITYVRNMPISAILEIDALSEDFIQIVVSLGVKCGCYLLYDTSGQLAYVGKSIDVSSRVMSSIKDRVKFSDIFWCEIVLCNSVADISVVEAYLIAAHKPYLNRDQYTNEPITVGVTNIPGTIGPFQIFKD